MQKKKIWLAATASVGIHVGLLALLSQAQAMPKAAPSAQPVTISVALNTTANPVAKPQQPELQKSQIAPTPTPDKPAIVKTSDRANKPAAKPVKAQPTPQRPATAKPRYRAPSQTSNTIATTKSATTTSATTATPSKAPVASHRPVASAHEHYPARYRGPQPAPDYPRMARRRGLEGTCLIEVLMDTRGDVITLALKQSTGHSVLDQAALAAVKSWKFIAPSGMTGASKALVPVRFNLT